MTQTVTTFYRFVDLPDCEEFRTRLEAECKTHAVLGTIILATEGLNATIAGSKSLPAKNRTLILGPEVAKVSLRRNAS